MQLVLIGFKVQDVVVKVKLADLVKSIELKGTIESELGGDVIPITCGVGFGHII